MYSQYMFFVKMFGGVNNNDYFCKKKSVYKWSD